jgi:hypothetical protein
MAQHAPAIADDGQLSKEVLDVPLCYRAGAVAHAPEGCADTGMLGLQLEGLVALNKASALHIPRIAHKKKPHREVRQGINP